MKMKFLVNFTKLAKEVRLEVKVSLTKSVLVLSGVEILE